MQLHLCLIGRRGLSLSPRGRSHTRRGVVGLWLASGLVPLALAGPGMAQTPPPVPALADHRPAQPQPMSAAERGLLDAINRYRRAQGRLPWQPEPALAQVARRHSQHMAEREHLSHEGFQRRAASTGSDLCVENLLSGQVSPEQAVQLWTRSPAHHDNLLEAAARYAGVGVAGRFVTLLACATPSGPVSAPAPATGPDNRMGRPEAPPRPR